jgi:hypothetical protein
LNKESTGQFIITLFFLLCFFLAFSAVAFGMRSVMIFQGEDSIWTLLPKILLIMASFIVVILCLVVYHFWKSKN